MTIRACRMQTCNCDLSETSNSVKFDYEVLESANKDDPISLYKDLVGGGYLRDIGSYYPGQYNLMLKSIRPTRSAGKSSMKRDDVSGEKCYVWKVTVDYSKPESSDDAGNQQAARIDASTESVDVALACDLDGRWNTNSAGEWFSDPLIFKQPNRVWSFQRREYYNPEQKASWFLYRLNQNAIWGCDPYTLYCREIRTSHSCSDIYWDVTYEIAFRIDGWLIRKADCGYCTLSDGALWRILNDDGSPLETPKLLNGYGQILSDGQPPVYRDYRCNGLNDFSKLELPDPFSESYLLQ